MDINSIKDTFKGYDHYLFNRQQTEAFVQHLQEQAPVYAPHKKGKNSYSYQEVKDAKNVVIDYPRTIQPIKKYFLPPTEVLLKFYVEKNDYNKVEIPVEKRIFFGIHSHEMQGLKCLDHSFSAGQAEWNYLARRSEAVFIGAAFNPDKWHFNQSVGIEALDTDGFSLFMVPKNDDVMFYVIDDMGKALIDPFVAKNGIHRDANGELPDYVYNNKIKIHYNRLPKIFKSVYNSKVWDEVAERCLGCGTCNLLCPTCYCFDVQDEIELDIENGVRTRFWDGCMLNTFAEVAGGENFREKYSQRTRHRLHRKFKYITDQTGDIFCVGCGRCTKYCPADISLVGIINDLVDEYTYENHNQATAK
jgi:sulfhydrogenase subunit beta (sulfur reductase)